MFKKVGVFTLLVALGGPLSAQKSKVQSAWRALSDYEETLKDGKPNLAFLTKAAESIDAALSNEETQKQAKTHAYKLRISYALFQYNYAEELKKLETTVSDKNDRALMAYGNVNLKDFEVAAAELNTIKDLDQKFLDNIQEGIAKGGATLDEDEIRFAQATQQMKAESSNIANGKYNSKKYGEAADYFYKTGLINSILNKVKDTTSFRNACISATKSKDPSKIVEYNQKMIDANIASAINYINIGSASLMKGDTSAAIATYKKGRETFPNDVIMLTEETNLFMAKGKTKEALANLKLATEKDPQNAFLFLFMANIYDNLANPKDKNGKDLERPANFDELYKYAESNYLKALELRPANAEHLYNTFFDLGAMYNNYGGMIANRKAEKITDLVKFQKENDAQAAVYFKKAIPYLEQALNLKPEDKQNLRALRVLYLKTGNEAKAKEMTERLDKLK